MYSPPAIIVAGAGLIGRKHIDFVADRARLAAIVDPDPGARELARLKDAPCFTDLESCLNGVDADGVILATPNQLHADQGLLCIDAGLPLLVEKPITDTTARALRLAEAAEQADVPVLVGHHRRHNALIKTAKAAIDEGRLGRIVAVNAQFWLYKPDAYFEPEWRRSEGAGPVFINLIHDIDVLRHLCGDIVRLSAMESRDVRNFEVEDTAGLLLQFANGAIGTVSVSDTAVAPWSWEFTSGENPAYPNIPTHAYTISGTHGALSIPDLKLWTHTNERGWWEPMSHSLLEADASDPLIAQFDHFLRVIRREEKPLVTARDGLHALQVVEEAKAAALTGELRVLA